MRELHLHPFISGVSSLVLFLGASGCMSNAEYCALTLQCGGGDGQGGRVPEETEPAIEGGKKCDGLPSQDPSVILEECGVFVRRSGEDSRIIGTRSEPVQTLSRAIELAYQGARRVYACAELFEESIEVPAGVEIYGGLDCDNGWVPSDSKKTRLTTGANEIPLRFLDGDFRTKLDNFEVTSKDATAMGGSSIATVAGDVEIELVRCSFIAGNGRGGEDGSDGGGKKPDAASGTPGSKACKPLKDALGGKNECGKGKVATNGGMGGKAGEVVSASAIAPTDGKSGEPVNGVNGLGGKTFFTYQDAKCPDQSIGTKGNSGIDGASGNGGTSNSIFPAGILNISHGYEGIAGLSGMDGTLGQGGGGGGGRSAGNNCSGMGNGSSGTPGGAGGCGGLGGLGGTAGGSSIALVSLGNTKVTLVDVDFHTGMGGRGGNGGSGQEGQIGGVSDVIWLSCSGGKGGDGGNGGRGGGGSGGHSIGIAYLFASITETNTRFYPGSAGAGGTGDSPSGVGKDGAAGQIVKFVQK